MTAPIRSMAALVEALRTTQVELGLSYELIDSISGLQAGYTAKLLGPAQSKRLGPISTFPLLGALGKAIAIVDDPEQISAVKGRWKQRKIVGGSSRQMRQRAENAACAPSLSTSLSISERMREIRKMVKKESLVKAGKNSAKRRAKTMSKRARQRVASHAARMRWSRAQASS
jgi:hypothetical protein